MIVFGTVLLLNVLIFVVAQDRHEVEPLTQSMLSLIFPACQLPSTDLANQIRPGNITNHNSLKLFFWVSLSGNLTLLGAILGLCLLYHLDIYNPWCASSNKILLIPERLMMTMHFPIVALCTFATIPVTASYAVQACRYDFLLLSRFDQLWSGSK
jgi:hypothetical protein